MRIIFAGTPDFAAASLKALIDSRHQVIAVLTQPDRPAGRGRKLKPSAVKQVALENELAVLQPASLKDQEIQSQLASLKAQVMVVAAYGLLLPESVLTIPQYGCINIHASLLPRWRGAAPIHRAIEAGDEKTGVSIMQMDAGLDTGDVIDMQSVAIEETDTSLSLHDKLAALGARLIVQTMNQIDSGTIIRKPQDESGACYAQKLSRQDSAVDWHKSAKQIVRKIHAFNPWPGAKTHFQDTPLKLSRARSVDTDSKALPGTVTDTNKKIVVQAADQGVEILELQKPGSRSMAVEEFLNGFELKPGDRLD